ncbi:MAG: hypothetical protein ABIZ81_17405 [Opitutaceae bacterium]
MSYQYKPSLGFRVDVLNAMEDNLTFYKGSKDRGVRRLTRNFVSITFGVNGRF